MENNDQVEETPQQGQAASDQADGAASSETEQEATTDAASAE